jgi:hypothetical protein
MKKVNQLSREQLGDLETDGLCMLGTWVFALEEKQYRLKE